MQPAPSRKQTKCMPLSQKLQNLRLMRPDPAQTTRPKHRPGHGHGVGTMKSFWLRTGLSAKSKNHRGLAGSGKVGGAGCSGRHLATSCARAPGPGCLALRRRRSWPESPWGGWAGTKGKKPPANRDCTSLAMSRSCKPCFEASTHPSSEAA